MMLIWLISLLIVEVSDGAFPVHHDLISGGGPFIHVILEIVDIPTSNIHLGFTVDRMRLRRLLLSMVFGLVDLTPEDIRAIWSHDLVHRMAAGGR